MKPVHLCMIQARRLKLKGDLAAARQHVADAEAKMRDLDTAERMMAEIKRGKKEIG